MCFKDLCARAEADDDALLDTLRSGLCFERRGGTGLSYNCTASQVSTSTNFCKSILHVKMSNASWDCRHTQYNPCTSFPFVSYRADVACLFHGQIALHPRERGSWESDLITDRDVAIEIPSCADFPSRGYPDVPPDEAISPSLVYVDSTLTQ